MVLNGSSSKMEKQIPVYTGRERIVYKTSRRQPCYCPRYHLNVLCFSNSNPVSTGIKPFCSKIAFNKNQYHTVTNHLTRIADQWIVFFFRNETNLCLKEFSNSK